jgi:hypothetical protein
MTRQPNRGPFRRNTFESLEGSGYPRLSRVLPLRTVPAVPCTPDSGPLQPHVRLSPFVQTVDSRRSVGLMKVMRRRRSRSSIAGLASLSALFALLVQLAPTLHALTSHDDHASSCTHASKSLHLEAASRESNPPCIVCGQLMGRQALLSPIQVRIDSEVRPLPLLDLSLVLPKDLVTTFPAPRGPPSAF